MIKSSFIHDDGAIHLSDYSESNKNEKEIMRLVDLLGDKLSEVEKLCKELRYYALYIDWGDGKPSHLGILADFHNFLHHMKEHYDWRREHLFIYMRDFEKHYFRKLKPEVIEFIENKIDPEIEKAKCKTIYRK